MSKIANEVQEQYTPHDLQHSPVVLYQLKKRADNWQLRLADRITAFAGTMNFVWIHIAIFSAWVASGGGIGDRLIEPSAQPVLLHATSSRGLPAVT